MLFQLRGRTKEQILEALRQMRGQTTAGAGAEPVPAELQDEPLEREARTQIQWEQFWHYHEQLESSLVVIAPPPSSETVLDLLGPIPLKTQEFEDAAAAQATAQTAMDYLRTLYQAVSQYGILTGMNTGNPDP